MKDIVKLIAIMASLLLVSGAYAQSRHISVELYDQKSSFRVNPILSNYQSDAKAPLIKNITLPEQQLLVVAIDSNGNELSKTVVLNPLVTRVEVFNPTSGEIELSKFISREKGKLHVTLPESPEIAQLVIYQQVNGGLSEFYRISIGEPTVEPKRSRKSSDVFPVMDNGDPDNRSDLVLVAEGYTASEISRFKSDAERITKGYFAVSPYKEYKNFFNVWGVESISNRSGAGRNGYPKDTAFRSYFGCSGIDRLLCADFNAIDSYVRARLGHSQVDQILLVVNDQKYGGAGGGIATMSLASSAISLALHEVAHSYGLADEYSGGGPSCDTREPIAPNVTGYYGRKWDHWQDLDHVNWFEGGNYCDEGIYRPTYYSMMRNLGEPFYEVNSEALILRAYRYVDIIDAVTPGKRNVNVDAQQTFRVKTVKSIPNTVEATWYVDNNAVKKGESFTLSTSEYAAGQYSVKVAVRDKTDMVRKDDENVAQGSYTWNVALSGTGGCNGSTSLDVPTGLTAVNATADTFNAAWAAVDKADAYQVQLWQNGNGQWVDYNTTDSTSLKVKLTSEEIEGTTEKTAYFRVKATSSCGGQSKYSEWLEVKLRNDGDCSGSSTIDAPTGLTAANATADAFDASWATVDKADSYQVQLWQEGNKQWVNYKTTDSNSLRVNLTGEEIEGTTEKMAYFRVQALSSCGTQSAYSSWLEVKLGGQCDRPPARPSSLSVSNGEIRWANLDNATSYYLQRWTGSKWVDYKEAKKNSLTITSSTPTYLRVKAMNSCGSSGYSNWIKTSS